MTFRRELPRSNHGFWRGAVDAIVTVLWLTISASAVAQIPAQPQYPPQAPPAADAKAAVGNASKASPEYDPTTSRAIKSEVRTDGLRTLLWEVTSKNGTNTIYLFGTIHVGKPSFYPLPASVQKALTASTNVVVEADVTDQTDAAEIGRLIDYPKGDSIEKHISPQLLMRVKAQLEKRRIPFANVASLRPVILGGMLPIVEYVRLGYDMASGLDLA